MDPENQRTTFQPDPRGSRRASTSSPYNMRRENIDVLKKINKKNKSLANQMLYESTKQDEDSGTLLDENNIL